MKLMKRIAEEISLPGLVTAACSVPHVGGEDDRVTVS
jgi:hypothetical protein